MKESGLLSADACAGMDRLATDLGAEVPFDCLSLGVVDDGQQKLLVFPLSGERQARGRLRRGR